METLSKKIMIAYQRVIEVQPTYKIQDLVDWINKNGGINGSPVSREQVKRGIITIIERNQKL